MNRPALELTGVHHGYGCRKVLDGLDLAVAPGHTLALLGLNGAGKTTAIRAMLGLLKADAGSIRVLGLDPTRKAEEIRRRIGYLAEDPAMFGWMTVKQILRFTGSFYPTWNPRKAEEMRGRFDLSEKTKVRDLSKGQTVRLGLLLALAHEPELVILDDPALGLDPVMRRVLMQDVIAELQEAGRTVLFSSHLLYEVEPIADEIAILHDGRIIVRENVDDLRARIGRLILPADANGSVDAIPGVLDVRRSSRQTAVTVDDLAAARASLPSDMPVDTQGLNLDEIFAAIVAGSRAHGAEAARGGGAKEGARA